MRPMTRVLAVGLVVGTLATGAVASRATPAAPAVTAVEAVAQARAITDVQSTQAAAASRALAVQRAAAAAARAAAVALAARARVAAAPKRITAPAAAPPTAARVAVAPAAAVVTSTVPTYVRRGQAALARLSYPISRLGYRVVFKPGAGGLLGTTDSRTRTITVYVRSTMTNLVLDHTIAHEMGHALDFTRGTATRRLTYLGIRGLRATLRSTWFGCNDCTDYRTPAGDWAEVFAYWLAGPGDFRSQVGGAPSAAQLRLLAPLFRI